MSLQKGEWITTRGCILQRLYLILQNNSLDRQSKLFETDIQLSDSKELQCPVQKQKQILTIKIYSRFNNFNTLVIITLILGLNLLIFFFVGVIKTEGFQNLSMYLASESAAAYRFSKEQIWFAFLYIFLSSTCQKYFQRPFPKILTCNFFTQNNQYC